MLRNVMIVLAVVAGLAFALHGVQLPAPNSNGQPASYHGTYTDSLGYVDPATYHDDDGDGDIDRITKWDRWGHYFEWTWNPDTNRYELDGDEGVIQPVDVTTGDPESVSWHGTGGIGVVSGTYSKLPMF